MEPIDRRRFLGNTAVLTAAVVGPHAGAWSEQGDVTHFDGPDPDRRLARLARAGLEGRWAGAAGPAPEYRERLESELTLIRERGAARRFLAAAAIARFTRERGIAVSPGRGAAPSSLVAYALGVTAIDPVVHGLIFERFLNARVSGAPTFCIDVCAERRSEVVDFAVTGLGGTATVTGDATELPELGLQIAGLPALTSLVAAVARINRHQPHRPVDLAAIPLDDPAAYERLASGRAIAHPYLERWHPPAAPRHFEDLVAAIALSRPGPPGAPSAQRATPEGEGPAVDHPLVQPFLSGTRGLLLYQEQIMQIAVRVARYSLDDADVLRRALAKRHQETVTRQRDRFVLGAIAAGVFWPDAVRIFARLERAAPLTFNRSHAVACALIVYWAAHLDAHHPGALARPQS